MAAHHSSAGYHHWFHLVPIQFSQMGFGICFYCSIKVVLLPRLTSRSVAK